MFDRAVFSVLVGNVDDHMRNFGFLRRGATWELSPHFDVNPDVHGNLSHTPLVTGADPAVRDLRQLLDRAESFSLRPDEALRRCRQLQDVVATWPQVARRLGAEAGEFRLMRRAFATDMRH